MTENDVFCHSDLILTTNERNEWDEFDRFSYREMQKSQIFSPVKRLTLCKPELTEHKSETDDGLWPEDVRLICLN